MTLLASKPWKWELGFIHYTLRDYLQTSPVLASHLTGDNYLPTPLGRQQRHGRQRWKATDNCCNVFERTPNDIDRHRPGGDVWTTTTADTRQLATSTDQPIVPRSRRSPRTACDVVDCLLFITVVILFLCYLTTIVLVVLTKWFMFRCT